MSVDDVRMDLTRVQGKEVEEGLQRLQRVTHSANMDNKSKLVGGVDLMLEKMKRLTSASKQTNAQLSKLLFLLSFKTSNDFTNCT